MGSPALPQMMARNLIAKFAGQNPSPMPQQGSPQPSPAGQQLSQQLSELQGADPEAMMKSLSQVKALLVSLYPRAAFTIPEVARELAQATKYLDNAIEKTKKAAETAAAVTPIANNAAIPNPSGAEQGMGLQEFASGGAQ